MVSGLAAPAEGSDDVRKPARPALREEWVRNPPYPELLDRRFGQVGRGVSFTPSSQTAFLTQLPSPIASSGKNAPLAEGSQHLRSSATIRGGIFDRKRRESPRLTMH